MVQFFKVMATAGVFYCLPFALWMLVAGFMQNPHLFWALVALFAVFIGVSAFQTFAKANDPFEEPFARYDARQPAEVAEEVRLIMSPDFDLFRSVVPRGRVGAHRRRPGLRRPVATPWREAVGPALRR